MSNYARALGIIVSAMLTLGVALVLANVGDTWSAQNETNRPTGLSSSESAGFAIEMSRSGYKQDLIDLERDMSASVHAFRALVEDPQWQDESWQAQVFAELERWTANDRQIRNTRIPADYKVIHDEAARGVGEIAQIVDALMIAVQAGNLALINQLMTNVERGLEILENSVAHLR